jgi:hypothetical protein
VNGRRRLELALVVGTAAVLAGATVAILTLPRGHGGSTHRARTVAQIAPVADSLPRRRRPPQVVEPVAGQATGTAGGAASDTGTIETEPAPRPPSDAEIRRELTQLQAEERRYHFDQFDYSHVLLSPGSLPGGGWHSSVASVFYDYFKPIACGGVLRPEQLGVAHRSAPCGLRVTFRYGGRAIRVPVIDRGPYIQGREWDLTGAAAAALHFPGLGLIDWHVG